jgi:hypothetical protein
MTTMNDALELRCDMCGAMPGEQCHIVLGPGAGTPRIPHVSRWADAEEASSS